MKPFKSIAITGGSYLSKENKNVDLEQIFEANIKLIALGGESNECDLPD